MKKIVTSIVIILIALFTLSCGTNKESPASASVKPSDTVPVQTNYEDSAQTFTQNLIDKNYAACVTEFSTDIAKALPEAKLKEVWETTSDSCGDFIKIEKNEVVEQNGLTTIVEYCAFSKNGLTVSITYDDAGKISGLWFNYYEPQNLTTDVAANVEEVDITLGEDYPLLGKLAKQKNSSMENAVVLVHGSGSSDMDETIGANKPFRDIAQGLATEGIDVLRYNKRTFDYPQLASDPSFTVQQESIDDALLAAQMLKDMGYKKIYLAGHSLGGMLALRIDSQTDLFDGIVSLAGSPRTLIDIVLDQNQDVIDRLTTKEEKTEAQNIINTEKAKLDDLKNLTKEDLKNSAKVFGMPASYVYDLINTDTFELASKYTKPILVLQGSEDFQVYANKDFSAFKEALKANPSSEFILYDGLNHLFMKSNGKTNIDEYSSAQKVDPKVIDDIAEFIKKH